MELRTYPNITHIDIYYPYTHVYIHYIYILPILIIIYILQIIIYNIYIYNVKSIYCNIYIYIIFNIYILYIYIHIYDSPCTRSLFRPEMKLLLQIAYTTVLTKWAMKVKLPASSKLHVPISVQFGSPLWWLGMDGGVEMESLKSDGRGHSLILSAINHLWTGTMIHPALAHFSGQRWSCCFKSLTQLSSPNERWRSNCQLLQSCMFQSAFSLVPLSLQGTGHLSAHQSSHWEWVWLRPQGHEDIVVVHSCQADMWSWCTWTNAMKWTALLIQRRKVTMVVQNSCGLLPAFSKLTKI